MRRRFLVLAVICACLLLARPAAAHGYILRSIPQDRAVLDRPPSRIQIWFSEALEPKFSTLTLANEKGEVIPLTQSGVPTTNTSQLSARLPSNVPDGAYIATFRVAFASDGHVVTDSLVFWVGRQTGTVAAQLATQAADPLEVGWRILTLTALNILFGALLLYQAVLLPGWGNVGYPAGGLAPRLMRRLSMMIWVSLIVALFGNIYALFQQSSVLFSTNLSTVLQNGLWRVVLSGTQFGDVLAIRLGLILIALIVHAASQYYAAKQPAIIAPLWAVNLIAAAVALGTISIGSHAAGATLWTPLAIGIDYIHLLMNAVWIGGLIALTLVFPTALAPLPDVQRRPAALAVLRRFSVLGAIAVSLLIVTGLFNALEYVRQPSDLPDTNYGRTLIVKIVLIIPLLLIALYHHGLVGDDPLAKWARRINFSGKVEKLATSLRLESAFGVGVVLAVSVLTASPPPTPPDARANAAPPSQTQTLGDQQVTLTIDPDASGANSYLVSVFRGKTPVVGAKVRLRFGYPALDRRSALLTLDNSGDGSYVGAGQELDRAGDWDVLVDVSAADMPYSPADRLAFRWQLPDVAPNAVIREPNLLNWLSIFSVLIVFGTLIRPSAVSALRAMRVQPENLVIFAVVITITVILVVVGARLLDQADLQTQALRNPPPAVVNPILADSVSLSAGKTLYTAKCSACHGDVGAWVGPGSQQIDLRDRLPNRHDEELFRLIVAGDAHKTVVGLSDADRWNVVNYLRSPVFAR